MVMQLTKTKRDLSVENELNLLSIVSDKVKKDEMEVVKNELVQLLARGMQENYALKNGPEQKRTLQTESTNVSLNFRPKI